MYVCEPKPTDDSSMQVPELEDPRRTGAPFRLRRDRLFRDERGSHGGYERDEPLGVHLRRGLGRDGRGYGARPAAWPDSGVLAGRGRFLRVQRHRVGWGLFRLSRVWVGSFGWLVALLACFSQLSACRLPLVAPDFFAVLRFFFVFIPLLFLHPPAQCFYFILFVPVAFTAFLRVKLHLPE